MSNVRHMPAVHPRQDCPPCTGQCSQGRMCPAKAPAEAATDIQGPERSLTHRQARAIFWSIYLLFLVIAVGGALSAIFAR